jgi:hypothetical protein
VRARRQPSSLRGHEDSWKKGRDRKLGPETGNLGLRQLNEPMPHLARGRSCRAESSAIAAVSAVDRGNLRMHVLLVEPSDEGVQQVRVPADGERFVVPRSLGDWLIRRGA